LERATLTLSPFSPPPDGCCLSRPTAQHPVAHHDCGLTRAIPIAKTRIGESASSGGTNDRLDLHRTSKQVGDIDHLKVFATARVAEEWFEDNDPLGVAFEYEVLD